MEPIKRQAATLVLSDMVETMGPVPYEKVLHLQRQAHAFLILGRKSDRKGHELVAGAKLFGYIQGRRPIVGVLPHDETRKILYQLGVSTIADVDSPTQISAVFLQVLNAWEDGVLPSLLPNRDACTTYSAERQTDALTYALERKVAVKPFLPGSVEVPGSLNEVMDT